MIACDADDGSLRWTEAVEGASGPAAVGEGLLAVPGGSGEAAGRRDRTITVLRATPPDNALFEAASRRSLLQAALAAAKDRRPATARLLLDPLRGWLSEEEVAPVLEALGEDG